MRSNWEVACSSGLRVALVALALNPGAENKGTSIKTIVKL
jgi:hypothetical protein